MGTVVQAIRDELQKNSDLKEKAKRTSWEKPYQENPQIYGVPTPFVRRLSAIFFREVRKKSKREVFESCESLLASGYAEERTIAFDWAFRLQKALEESDYSRLERWLMKHVPSWGACDDLCTHALGVFIFQFPQYIVELKKWAKSSNRWVRRASAVALIYSARRGHNLESVFQIANILLHDPDIMVQKGYGWMLKEASKTIPEQVFNYVQKTKRTMPRIALRYAIEKLPADKRKKAMEKESALTRRK
jgi:3-methyladenine DNA glycosylase AlkD